MRSKLLLLLLLPFAGMAQIPAYYNGVDFTQNGNALKSQLSTLITNTHTTSLVYTPGVWNALKQTDLDPSNPQMVFLIYGYNDADAAVNNDRTRDKDSSCHVSNCTGLWVREHTFAQSLGTPNLGTSGAGSDAHHLRAIDSQMNNSRGNRPYDDGSGNSAVLGNGNFYPGDEWKGDIARMMMYMYLRYPTQCLPTNVGTGSTSYSSMGDMPNIFLEWNEEDPVSQYEKNRNNILQGMQGNRNPFIDNPFLATKIWNGPEAPDAWGVLGIFEQTLLNVSVYPTVTTDYIYIANPEHKTYTYTVYNAMGQVIEAEGHDERIDLSKNSKGLYFIQLRAGSQARTVKCFLD